MARIQIVLHRSIYPRNIGMCARAMANMGLARLILVDPRCEINHEARQGAVHAQDILIQATIYESHEEFLAAEGEGIRIALSGRESNRLREPLLIDELMESLEQDREHVIHSPETATYLIFGPEDDGLSDAEMELCNYVCKLPTFGEITSLNLSHAVLMACYIVRKSILGSGQGGTAAPVPQPLSYPSPVIREWLQALGFDVSSPKVNIEKTLNRILLSRCPDPEELRILNTVIHQTVRKLKKD
jgi:tRNA/rRNA methyltransferase